LKKIRTDISVRSHPSVGLQWAADKSSIAVDWSQLPASDHFFVATHFDIKAATTGIKLLFGVKSSFDDAARNFDLAVEIHMPGPEAYLSLYQNVFIELSGNGKTTFYESLKDLVKKQPNTVTPNNYHANGIGLPLNRSSSFRIFPANFLGIAFTGHQAMIEFFEIPPDLLHFFRLGRAVRPGAGVKPVISVVIDSLLLCGLAEKCKSIFEGQNMKGVANEL
jgi:hypothetical protein